MSKRLLVLGGTEFVGRAVVDEAVAAGWSVDVFNRGSHPAPEGVRAFRGNRTRPADLAVLTDDWDLVVDTWSWAPSAVRDSATHLRDRADRYLYISTRSVYQFPAEDPEISAAGWTEQMPTVAADPDEDTFNDYARTKAGAELAVDKAFGDRAIMARAGLILGPHENIGRLPWWLSRIAEGGTVLAPGPATAPLQYIDVRDLALWCLQAGDHGLSGKFDIVSPSGHATMDELLQACIQATGSSAQLRWLDPEVIVAEGISPWTELPIWLPPGELHDLMHCSDVSKALANGLVCRPVSETVTDTWNWLTSIGGQAPQRADRPANRLTRAKEEQVLQDHPL